MGEGREGERRGERAERGKVEGERSKDMVGEKREGERKSEMGDRYDEEMLA